MRCKSYRLRFAGPKLSDQEIIGLHAMEREIRNFYLTESDYPPNMKVPTHRHENAFFYFILSGGMTESFGSVTREREPSTLVFTPPLEPHSNQVQKSGCRLFMIEAKANWLSSIKKYSHLPDSTSDLSGGSATSLARRAYTEACHADSFSPLVIEGLVLELLAETSRHQKRVDKRQVTWLKSARDILHDRFATKLTTEQVAKELGLHPIYFVSAFRRHHGCTVGEYIRQIRIEYACSQLDSSDRSLSEIALAAGFFDQSHFARTFKRMIGTTPGKYRDNKC